MDQRDFPQDRQNPHVISFLSLGGIEDIQKNLYIYQYKDEILLVDCGIGFADETMLGVDLLIPDISYLVTLLKSSGKKIVGMAISHGHEDHFGALPFILPQLPSFPIYASPFTAAIANEKLKDYRLQPTVQTVAFDGGEVRLGQFSISFIHMTHSVPDTANIFIKTPVGNFYHGSDYKLDLTPADGKKSDYARIAKTSQEGVLCLMSDCLGAERAGYTPTDKYLGQTFEEAMRNAKGKVFVTTFSSNVARINQVIEAAEKLGRKVCFVGRSLIKIKTLSQKLGYLQMKSGTEVEMEHLKNYPDNQVVLLVAGSQGQENSAMTRISNNEHKEIKLTPDDIVIFSSDPIPGNEISVSDLIDTIMKRGATAIYSDNNHKYHVSGHGSEGDNMLLMSLVNPKHLLPISGSYKNMVAYKKLGEKMGYSPRNIHLIETGQELLFSRDHVKRGKKIDIKNVYVDQISGEEVESYVLRDREKLAKEGIIILMVEVITANGQLADKPEVVSRGFSPKEAKIVSNLLTKEIKSVLARRQGKVTNWIPIRKQIEEAANKIIFRSLRRRPLVLPVIIEV